MNKKTLMSLWGVKCQEELTPTLIQKECEKARQKSYHFFKTPLEEILDVFHRLSFLWKGGGKYSLKAKEIILEDQKQRGSGFSEPMVDYLLQMIPELFNRYNLQRRVDLELGHLGVMDSFVQTDGEMSVRALPLGILLHVTASNVFLGLLDSLIMGLVTKNISIIKGSSGHHGFPLLFLESLKEADPKSIVTDKIWYLTWHGGSKESYKESKEIEKSFKSYVNGIIAWGGEEMVLSYRNELSPKVKLIDFGPKISIGIVSKRGLSDYLLHYTYASFADRVAQDVALYDQGACSSMQNLYIEEGIDTVTLLRELKLAFERYPYPRGELLQDHYVEIHKERALGEANRLLGKGDESKGKGDEFYIHLEGEKSELRPSPLGRTLLIKKFKDKRDLLAILSPYNYYLQTAGILLSRKEEEEGEEEGEWKSDLAFTGMKRITFLGEMGVASVGAPHDGKVVLRELVHFITEERSFDEMKIKGKGNIKNALLKGNYFASGGTSGDPKYTFYSHLEFQKAGELIAKGFKLQGLSKGSMVANLFAAGKMWSSFMVIHEALKHLEAVELPIGGTSELDYIISLLQKFKPTAICGLPSLIMGYAKYCEENNLDLSISTIFYAGEHLLTPQREYLKKVWKSKKFCSAGYASVDAGLVGYQCSYCKEGEHHLYSELVRLRIDADSGEGIVDSKLRSFTPIWDYPLGDRIEWSNQQDLAETSLCECGSRDRKFILKGRVGNIINIWSCRIDLRDIELGLERVGHPLLWGVQLLLKIPEHEHEQNSVPKEYLKIVIEDRAYTDQEQEELKHQIYELSTDLKKTLTFLEIEKLILIEKGVVTRVERTGKVKRVEDLRVALLSN